MITVQMYTHKTITLPTSERTIDAFPVYNLKSRNQMNEGLNVYPWADAPYRPGHLDQ
jgi:hypothetical protein